MLINVSDRIVAAIKPGGRLILSGMLAPQAEETMAAFRARGVIFERLIRKGKWATALGSLDGSRLTATQSP